MTVYPAQSQSSSSPKQLIEESLTYLEIDASSVSPTPMARMSDEPIRFIERQVSHIMLHPFYSPPISGLSDQPLLTQGEQLSKESPLVDSSAFTSLVSLLNVVSYVGCDRDGLPHGQGAARTLDGDSMSGEWQNGRLVNQSNNQSNTPSNNRFEFADGTTMEGSIDQSTLSGHGHVVYSDGSEYEGGLVDGFRNGFGRFIDHSNNRIYSGGWLNGIRHGKGRLSYDLNESSYYEGDWVDGRRHGHGKLVYSNNQSNNQSIYEGDWVHDVKQGFGCMQWSSGECYVGQFDANQPHGEGRYTYTSNLSTSQSINQLSLTHPVANEYIGTMKHGARHGRGIFQYSDGSVFFGNWSNNEKHGLGRFVWPNGAELSGTWKEDAIDQSSKQTIKQSNNPVATQAIIHSIEQWNHQQISEIDLSLIRDLLNEQQLRQSDNQPNSQTHTESTNILQSLQQTINQYYQSIASLYSYYAHYPLTSLPADESPNGQSNASLNQSINQGFGVRLIAYQMWNCLIDCGLIDQTLTLCEINRMWLQSSKKPQKQSNNQSMSKSFNPSNGQSVVRLIDCTSIHEPRQIIWLREFIYLLIRISAHQTVNQSFGQSSGDDEDDQSLNLSDAFDRLMMSNILPRLIELNNQSCEQSIEQTIDQLPIPASGESDNNGEQSSEQETDQAAKQPSSQTIRLFQQVLFDRPTTLVTRFIQSLTPSVKQSLNDLFIKRSTLSFTSIRLLNEQSKNHSRSQSINQPVEDRTINMSSILECLQSVQLIDCSFTRSHVLKVVEHYINNQSNSQSNNQTISHHTLLYRSLIEHEFIELILALALYRFEVYFIHESLNQTRLLNQANYQSMRQAVRQAEKEAEQKLLEQQQLEEANQQALNQSKKKPNKSPNSRKITSPVAKKKTLKQSGAQTNQVPVTALAHEPSTENIPEVCEEMLDCLIDRLEEQHAQSIPVFPSLEQSLQRTIDQLDDQSIDKRSQSINIFLDTVLGFDRLEEAVE